MGFLLRELEELERDGIRCESVMWTATANMIMAVSQLFRLAQGRLIDKLAWQKHKELPLL